MYLWVLITRHHILTAGHCLPRSVPRFLQYTNYYIAWGGNSNSQYIDDRITRRAEISDTNFKSGEQIRTCNHWYKHPDQDSLRFIYDIGVIKCDLAFNLIRDVLEIVPMAPNFPFQEDTPLEMYGWGVVNKHNDRSIRLRKYTTYTQDITTCQNEHINITATHHICTYNRASQSYKGDSGAPALYTMPRKRCHKPGSRTQHKPGSKTKSDSRAGSRTKSDKCTRSKTRCGPLTINLDELCEAISDKSNRSTQTHNTVCLHYSCDTISSSRTNDSNNSTQAHYTVLLNDLYKINYTTNSNRPIGTAHLECHFDGTKRDRGEAPNVTKFVKGEAPNATTFVKGSSISTAQNASSLGLAPNGSSLGLPQNVSSFERHTCGNTIYHISPSQTQSPYCKNSNICFTSNTTCAKTALCCKVINQEHVIRCVRNSSLHLAAYISGTHSSLPEPNGKFSQKTNLNTINNTTETKINITETEFLQRTNFNTTISNVTKTNTEADKFAERNYVCSQNGEDGFAEDYDCSQTGESDVESYGMKVIVGITSFHLDTFVVLTNITEEYYRFVYDVINMT
ncbi:hypothetical protein M8J75_000644 [Diaphorina citri]|nr:hypothetical protein M8J75_000644 [Diaphorina citri]